MYSQASKIGLLIALAMLPFAGESSNVRGKIPPELQNALPDGVAERLYSIVILRIRDKSRYAEYLGHLSKIVADRRLETSGERLLTLERDSETAPESLNVVFYKTSVTRDRLRADPEFQRIVHLRDDNTDMYGLDGVAVGGETRAGPTAGRVYLVELATFLDEKGATAYAHYMRTALPVLRTHGFHIERTLLPTAGFGGVSVPDVANIVYFDSKAQMVAMEADPRHQELEALYTKSVKTSQWYVGSSIN